MAKSKKLQGSRKALPPALARRAKSEVASKHQRLLTEAAADIGLIKRRRERIAEDFYDIGEALIRLKRPAVLEVLNCKSFGELCDRVLKLSRTSADLLVRLATRLTRADATKFGQERAAALIALADATPADDTPGSLAATVLQLPSGAKLKIESASVNDLKGAAEEFRKSSADAGGDKARRGRGRTSTPAEREAVDDVQSWLREHGFPAVKVRAVATRPGQPSNARIENVPIASLHALGAALSAHGRGGTGKAVGTGAAAAKAKKKGAGAKAKKGGVGAAKAKAARAK